jgi:outer membrane protein insertion porin family
MYQKYSFILCIAVALFAVIQLSSCNYAKHIKPSETLLWQNRIVYKANKIDKTLREDISSQIGAAIVQKKLNTAIFGLDLESFNIGYRMPRRRLLNYNLLYNQIEKKGKNFYIKGHIAERPVVFNPEATKKSISNIKTALRNQGYFYANIYDSVVQKPKQKTCVYYVVDAQKNYAIKKVDIICSNEKIKEIINKSSSESFTKPGEPLTLSNISRERDRISQLLIANGFYYMRPEGILPEVDTTTSINKAILADEFGGAFLSLDTSQNKPSTTANIKFTITDSIGELPLTAYYYKNIIVNIGNNVAELKKVGNYIEHNYKNLVIRSGPEQLVTDEVIFRNIFVKGGDLFTISDAEATLNRLNSLKVFSTVKLETMPSKDGSSNELDCVIDLNIAAKYTDKIELEGSNSPGVYDGGLNAKYSILNNNVFKGANLLSVGAHAGLLMNRRDKKLQLFQYTYGANMDLSFPKFLLVQDITKINKNYLPITKIGVGLDVYARPSTFTQRSLNADITYKWQVTKKINYKLTPLFINYVSTPDKSINPVFYDSISAQIRNQLKNISIIGSNASVEYSNKLATFQPHYSYLRLGIERAGALAEAGLKIFDTKDPAIVKYTMLQAQIKHYINSKKTTWVNRAYANIGIPGKNNASLPLIKQLSAGGGASMRGWGVNALGPGSSNDSALINNYINRGDLQLELNSEYQFKMFRLFSTVDFEGALFVDAGNVWLYNNTAGNDAAQFKWNKLGKDVAINTGYGLRLDFSLLVLRIDWGVKLKTPYVSENGGWTNNFNFRSKAWRDKYQAVAIGLSYPF